MNYLPVEVITALALVFVVDPGRQGWGAYDPLLERIAELFARSPGSIAEKERNLLGVRPNAGAGERALFAAVAERPGLVFDLWERTLLGARDAGIDADRLPDVLDAGGAYELLGQDELDGDLRALVSEDRGAYEAAGHDPETSERAAVAMARIGQHRFATKVRSNYVQRCGFCGLDTEPLANRRLLLASHVKPWRDGSTVERLDPRNGVAACPTHDAAFDGGLLTVSGDGRIHRARLLRDASDQDQIAHTMFTATVLEHLLVAPEHRPKAEYVEWHHEHVWLNGIGAIS